MAGLQLVDGVKEFPGVPVAGLIMPWLVDSEISVDFKRRLRTEEVISRGDEADEVPEAVETYDIDGNSGAGLTLLENVTGVAPHIVNLQALGESSAGVVEVESKKGSLLSFASPSIRAQFAHYRQLLVNPHFDDATDGRGWNDISGPASEYVDSSTSLNFVGKHVHASSNGTTVIDQVVDDRVFLLIV